MLPNLILLVGGNKFHLGLFTTIVLGVPLLSQLIFAGYLSAKIRKKFYLLLEIYLRVVALLGVAFTLTKFDQLQSSAVIALVYIWMFMFAFSGAFAGISYTDILGKSIEGEVRKIFLVLRQFLSSGGILLSALVARQLLKSLAFPQNYQLLFTAAAGLLFIASFGFVAIKERPTEAPIESQNFIAIIKMIPQLLRSDSNLKNYIILANLIGFTITISPFYIALAKDQFNMDAQMVGNFLLFQITGMVVSNLLWSRVVKKSAFKGVLKFAVVIQGLMPAIALLFSAYFAANIYTLVFFISGSAFSAYRIAIEGVMLEITTESNRVLYAGVIGAFNLTIPIFPILAGITIATFGYTAVFLSAGTLTLSSFYFIHQLRCSFYESAQLCPIQIFCKGDQLGQSLRFFAPPGDFAQNQIVPFFPDDPQILFLMF